MCDICGFLFIAIIRDNLINKKGMTLQHCDVLGFGMLSAGI